jgi:hypothetical protein
MTRPACCEAFYPDYVVDGRVIGLRVCFGAATRRRGRRWVCRYHARTVRVFFKLPARRIVELRDLLPRSPLLDANVKRIKREMRQARKSRRR